MTNPLKAFKRQRKYDKWVSVTALTLGMILILLGVFLGVGTSGMVAKLVIAIPFIFLGLLILFLPIGSLCGILQDSEIGR